MLTKQYPHLRSRHAPPFSSAPTGCSGVAAGAAYNLIHIIVYVYVHAAYFLQCFLLCCVFMYTMLAHFSLLLLLLLN